MSGGDAVSSGPTIYQSNGLRSRRIGSFLGTFSAALCAGIAAAVLLLILGYVLREGGAAINPSFLTALPRPVGVDGGGVANGIVGSAIIIALSILIATPVGILTGVYLA